MKIKTWLLLSYLIVMLLPLGAAYGLIAWINTYHKEKNVEEYFEKWLELQQIIEVVENPELYQLGREYEELEQLTSAHTEIYLYSKEGYLLYTSNPIKTTVSTIKSEEDLYQNLYEFQQSYYAYKYRSPALRGKNILGFYEINLARSEWVTGVSNRSWIIVCVVTAIFLIIFIVVVLLVNRKLNRPLDFLTKQMKVFAEKNEISPIRESNDEIGELAESFDEMRKQITVAREKIAMEQHEKEYMIASISHDLKTPLTSICAYAELLSSKRETKNTDEYSQIIIEKSNFMKQMLDDLLMYTVLQSPTYEMELVEVEGAEFFDMLLSDYEPLCEEKGIMLERYCMIDGKYYVNPKQMLRVMDNLTSNAIKHTNSGGDILLLATNKAIGHHKIMPFAQTLLTNDNGMYLIVQNSGEGIDHAELKHLFKPLYQADSARTKNNNHTGTGLGLSITKQIMEKHGGKVQIVSEKNIGTCVVCWLPN